MYDQGISVASPTHPAKLPMFDVYTSYATPTMSGGFFSIDIAAGVGVNV
jgi:hypothetical protein